MLVSGGGCSATELNTDREAWLGSRQDGVGLRVRGRPGLGLGLGRGGGGMDSESGAELG